MAYHELEQFLGRGEEKAVWIFSFKNLAGLIVGGIIAQRLAVLLLEPGLLTALIATLGAVVGVTLTMQRHGVILGRRLLIRLRFYVFRSTKPRVIDAALCYTHVEEREQPVRMRTVDGTPVVHQRTAGAAATNGRH